MDWFYVADQRQVGPVNDAEFARLVSLGAIRGETLVWRAGMKDWQAYSSFFPPEMPPGTGTAAAPASTASDAAAPGVMSPVRPVDVPRYGGFWIRFLARLVDWLILFMVNGAVTIPLGLGGLGMFTGSHDMFDLAS